MILELQFGSGPIKQMRFGHTDHFFDYISLVYIFTFFLVARPITSDQDSSNQDVTAHPEHAAQYHHHEIDVPRPLHLKAGEP